MPNPDIFLSYSREDKPRVAVLADALAAAGRSVWWDVEIPIGSRFREAINGALNAATAVVVVWSRTSVAKDFVLDEAARGVKRGVLYPVKIDEVELPLGFGQFQFANLVSWSGGAHPELERLQQAVGRLVTGLVKPENRWWPDLADSAKWTEDAVQELRKLTVSMQTAVELFRRAPAAMASLAVALREVYGTYTAVQEAIDLFLAPLKSGSLSYDSYAAMARGRISTAVAAKRGHCTAISLVYWSHGGIRSLLTAASAADLQHLDEVFGTLGTADGDVFETMTRIAESLGGESSAIANMIVAGQDVAARDRLATDARHLASLETALNVPMAELLRFAGELGIVLNSRA